MSKVNRINRVESFSNMNPGKILPLFLLFHLLISYSVMIGQDGSLLIKNTNYFDTETRQMKQGSILIKEGKIKKIATSISANRVETVIDGKNKYLIPGLVDAHIHLFQSGGLYTRPDAIDLAHIRSYEQERQWLKDNAGDLLKRYLKAGITTVIDVGGPMHNYTIRDKYNKAKEYPTVYLTGPLISTYQPQAFQIDDPPIIKVNSTEEAREMVRKQVPYKPDFIKIWYIVLPTQSAETSYDIVQAAIDESHKNNLRVAVHATQLNTAKLAIKAGADILVHSVDTPVDKDFLRLVKENEVVYIPTLIVGSNYDKVFSQEFVPSAEDWRYAHPIPLGSISDMAHLQEEQEIKEYREYAPRMKERGLIRNKARTENIKVLMNESVVVATGTDAGNIGTMHASSYFQELRAMKDAGLSNADILIASTINGAKVLGKEADIGSIKTHKVADLLLLDKNPLEDLNALQDIHILIKNGHPLNPDTMVSVTPELLAQQQLNAYNKRNIDEFLAPYSDNVEIYRFPDKLISRGKDKMRLTYSKLFDSSPNLHCQLVNRTILDDTVIDHEKVKGMSNSDAFMAIAIYKISDNKISKVYIIQ